MSSPRMKRPPSRPGAGATDAVGDRLPVRWSS
jgi:hypothetical protein